ncbi:hypothetical protein BACPEC_02195 [[Bacteroides] pectinophilus ATCC 43243]|uniref:Uncharacterized protein n=1 Tax=[Bacteroides] pectinophilus ATCC 43243 TaxID=483218 RepID=B7ASY6_9FIRM|nr:hypothetical protein BACPEC_02195 [[Bacteroides] pectinophilus ATCC 43243]
MLHKPSFLYIFYMPYSSSPFAICHFLDFCHKIKLTLNYCFFC